MALSISGIEVSLYSGGSEIPVFKPERSNSRVMMAYVPSEAGQVRFKLHTQ